MGKIFLLFFLLNFCVTYPEIINTLSLLIKKDSNRFADDLLGEVTLSVLDFMEMEDDQHYGVLNSNRSVDWWPLTYATKNGIVPAGEIRLQIELCQRRQKKFHLMLVFSDYHQ